ncbi:MAG: tetratricopeptide repeat protein [Maricaulaceae bacterium]
MGARRSLGPAGLLALMATACATTDPVLEEVGDALAQKSIAPASAEAREAVGRLDLLTQATFWADEFDKNPGDLEAARNLARALRAIGSHQRAVEVARQSLALYPADVELTRQLALASVALGAGLPAVDAVRAALAVSPNDPGLMNALGVAYELADRPALARASYADALRYSPAHANALTNMGLSYLIGGDPEEAERWLRQAVEAPGSGAQARQNLALAVGLQGRFTEAEQIAGADTAAEIAQRNINGLRDLLTQPASWTALRDGAP